MVTDPKKPGSKHSQVDILANAHLSLRLALRVVDWRVDYANNADPKLDVLEFNSISALTEALTRLVTEATRRSRPLKKSIGSHHTGASLLVSLRNACVHEDKTLGRKETPLNFVRKLGSKAFKDSYLALLAKTLGDWGATQDEDDLLEYVFNYENAAEAQGTLVNDTEDDIEDDSEDVGVAPGNDGDNVEDGNYKIDARPHRRRDTGQNSAIIKSEDSGEAPEHSRYNTAIVRQTLNHYQRAMRIVLLATNRRTENAPMMNESSMAEFSSLPNLIAFYDRLQAYAISIDFPLRKQNGMPHTGESLHRFIRRVIEGNYMKPDYPPDHRSIVRYGICVIQPHHLKELALSADGRTELDKEEQKLLDHVCGPTRTPNTSVLSQASTEDVAEQPKFRTEELQKDPVISQSNTSATAPLPNKYRSNRAVNQQTLQPINTSTAQLPSVVVSIDKKRKASDLTANVSGETQAQRPSVIPNEAFDESSDEERRRTRNVYRDPGLQYPIPESSDKELIVVDSTPTTQPIVYRRDSQDASTTLGKRVESAYPAVPDTNIAQSLTVPRYPFDDVIIRSGNSSNSIHSTEIDDCKFYDDWQGLVKGIRASSDGFICKVAGSGTVVQRNHQVDDGLLPTLRAVIGSALDKSSQSSAYTLVPAFIGRLIFDMIFEVRLPIYGIEKDGHLQQELQARGINADGVIRNMAFRRTSQRSFLNTVLEPMAKTTASRILEEYLEPFLHDIWKQQRRCNLDTALKTLNQDLDKLILKAYQLKIQMDLSPSKTTAFWLQGYQDQEFPNNEADDLQGGLEGMHKIEMTTFPGAKMEEDGTVKVLCKAMVKVI